MECNKIAQPNWFDAQEVKEFYKNPESRRKHCMGIVGDTAYMLGELLEEAAASQAAKKD
jgi:hypothetical protein